MWPWLFYTRIKGSERGLCSEGLWWLCETPPLAIATLKIGDRDSGSSLVDFHSCVPVGTCPWLLIFLPSAFISTITFSSPPSSQSVIITLSGICFSGSLWILPKRVRAETADVTHTIKPKAEATGWHPILTDEG